MEPKHKRRVRYSGTHPKKYNEKYKIILTSYNRGNVITLIALKIAYYV